MGLTADQKLVRKDVPGAALDAALTNALHQSFPTLGTNLEIVTQHYGLAVKQEGAELRITVERIQERVDKIDQSNTEVLICCPPLAIPMGVMHQEQPVVRRGSGRTIGR